MMAELFNAVVSWHSLVLAVVVFGFAPGFILRLAVKIYPPTSSRRNEIIADLYVMRRIERPFYVAEQLETVLTEGVAQRFSYRRYRRRSKQAFQFIGEVLKAVKSDDQQQLERIAKKYNLQTTFRVCESKDLTLGNIGLKMIDVYEHREQVFTTFMELGRSRSESRYGGN